MADDRAGRARSACHHRQLERANFCVTVPFSRRITAISVNSVSTSRYDWSAAPLVHAVGGDHPHEMDAAPSDPKVGSAIPEDSSDCCSVSRKRWPVAGASTP